MIDPLKLTEFEVLLLTIIGEARGEPIQGQVAVGCAIRNRLYGNPDKYKSYKDVCLEPKQFSCWNETDTNRAYLLELAERFITGQQIEDPHLRQCILVATGVKDWAVVDNTNGARNYVTEGLFNSPDRPKWIKSAKNAYYIGHQVFFNV